MRIDNFNSISTFLKEDDPKYFLWCSNFKER